jgi:hypothetical protein
LAVLLILPLDEGPDKGPTGARPGEPNESTLGYST